MGLDKIFEGIKEIFTGGDNNENENNAGNGGVLPASQDPYGDAGDQTSVLPASQDPYGDAGDQQTVLPASQDPYGDPADQR
ncbi:MAG: translation initiation factor [Capsulimonas sp.]|jgi:hypothetical protein|nr:translation initiation factor [Capsulimonas sp.]